MHSKLSISIVIPVLGDLYALDQILAQLNSSACNPDEIIVVDGMNDPDCAAMCAARGCVHLNAAPRRGHQLDTGAHRARGDIIWFLHADARPMASAAEAIRQAIHNGAIGGYFRFEFTGEATWYKRWLAALINLRSRIGVPYGDQGLFIRRSAYSRIGGFPDTPLFEEVPLVKAARRNGRFERLQTPIGVSPRRWERDGWLSRSLANRCLALAYIAGISPTRLARYYPSDSSSIEQRALANKDGVAC